MFTGIVESLGEIISVEQNASLLHIWLKSDFIEELKIDQSIAHNGICLTVDQMKEDSYRVTAIEETVNKTNISNWEIGNKVNIERCLRLGDRLDGHMVQGHVDTIAECVDVFNQKGEIEFTFKIDTSFSHLIVEKGSICIDGISLTCHSLTRNSFKVSIIPYTYDHTIANQWRKGTSSNIEFDIIGKYLSRSANLNS